MTRTAVLLVTAAAAAASLPATAHAAASFSFHSLGANGGNGAFEPTFAGISEDGTHVFFTTDESLVSADTDTAVDLYESTGGTVFLRSDSTAGGVDPNTVVTYRGVSKSGRAFFTTAEQLQPTTDTDAQTDVYGSSTTTNPIHVSRGAMNGNGTFPATYGGVSADGNRVFFTTHEQLVAGDGTDMQADVYRWDIATSSSTNMSASGNGNFPVTFGANSPDGNQVAFLTVEALDASDADANTGQDLYRFNASTSTLTPLSTDAAPGAADTGDGTQAVFLLGAANSFDKFVFVSNEHLTASDTDLATRGDFFLKRDGQVVEHVTQNTAVNFGVGFGVVSPSDGRVYFQSSEAVCCGDADTATDIFQYLNGTLTLVSNPPVAAPAATTVGFSPANMSPDGSTIFFTTTEQLLPATDTDGSSDVYARTGSTTVHVSQGQQNGNGAFDAFFAGSSADGSRAFFLSAEPLTSDDSDAQFDIFERSNGSTSRVTLGPNGGNGADGANAVGQGSAGVSATGTRFLFSTTEQLFATDTDSQADLFGWEFVLNVPTIATTASPGITLGAGELSDTATVSGRDNPSPGATVDFRLYGPDDATCSGAPVFQSTGNALSVGGTATSAAFTPTAAGTYRWRAFYSGDENNAPVSGACNDANENVTVSAPAGGGDPGGGDPGGGDPGGGDPGGTTDTVRPSVTAFGLTNKAFRRGRAKTPITGVATRKAPKGTRFRYTLSEAATAVIDLQRILPGRRKDGKCRKPTAKLRQAKKCKRYVSRGKLTRLSLGGPNRVSFSGRLGRKKLAAGKYRAVLTATDLAGNKSKRAAAKFRVLPG